LFTSSPIDCMFVNLQVVLLFAKLKYAQ